MELECAKYGDKMDAEQAACQHPGDYCQHRSSCMIQFIERENKGKTTIFIPPVEGGTTKHES